MKKRVFDLVRYVISAAIIIAMFCFSYLVLSNAYKSEEIDENISFHSLPENTMDVIVLGSSHAQYSFSPAFFYQETGLYSYVLGTQCQPLEVSYLMLKEALKTQSPKAVILEVFTAMPLRSGCDGVSCYITAGYQMRGNEKYSALKKLPEDKYETYVNPFISSHNDWRTKEIKLDKEIESIKNTITSLKENEKDIKEISNYFGFHDIYPTLPVENSWYANFTDEYIDVELKKEDMDALNGIYDLCKEKEIELILYKTPIDSLDVENLSYLKKVWEWAEEKNIQYIDFVKDSPQLGFRMCIHSGSFHSFVNGASIITNNLAKLFKDKQITHAINDELEKMYYDAANGFTMTYLKTEYDPSKYFIRLINFKGPMLIIYNGDKAYSNLIKTFLNKYEINGPSVVFVDNEQIIDRSDNCVGLEYLGKYIYSDFNIAEIEGNVYENNCGLSIVVFGSNMEGHYKVDTNLSTSWKNGFNWYGE